MDDRDSTCSTAGKNEDSFDVFTKDISITEQEIVLDVGIRKTKNQPRMAEKETNL